MRFEIFGRQITLTFRKPVWTEGIKSTCVDGRHVLFLDFDQTKLSVVKASCRILQNLFHCGTFYIFESSKDS